jgi:hypothetical protein
MRSTTGTGRTTLNLTHRALARGLDPRVAKSHGCSAPPLRITPLRCAAEAFCADAHGAGPMAGAAGSQDLEAGR